ncbi:TNF receptor-associated factor 5-like [Stylophora pistillata]|uniref:TNF receptor-associated factor 5-like n=1 Tax=Stylophora pistillata TaxID=50429 RepID=UPI000C038DC9|nr:TNF receptor-associated factor 5-like [Stylophora pistillata]
MAVASERSPSGYDEEFVSEVEEDLQCLICYLPLKDPVQTRCGHRFCKGCLDDHFRRQEIQRLPLTCPADRDGLVRDRDVFPDKATERKILSFSIKCPSEDCEWTGELREKEVHLSSCVYKAVPCPNLNCLLKVQRQHLSYHVSVFCEWRIVNCDHCSEPRPQCHMQDHFDQCSQFPVTCPNNCGCSVPRGLLRSNALKRAPTVQVFMHFK